MLDLLVMDHCQDAALVADGVMHEGYWSTVLGVRGWLAEGEELMVSRNILLAEKTGARVHCQHLSAAGSVRLLREAQRSGVNISGEACPHHFTLTDAAIAGSAEFWKTDGKGLLPKGRRAAPPCWPTYDTNLKMNPPLRSAQDRQAILQAVADGTLEAIATDHAPHCNYEKDVEFDQAPSGITGLETALSLALMRFYHSRRMGLSDLLARFTVGPARLLRLKSKGSLAKGKDGDVTVFDPNTEWQFTPEQTCSKSLNSPFYGWPLKGKVLLTIVGGKIVWREPGFGAISG